MAFNKKIYNIRYDIEQKNLPERFFETPRDVIASILEPGNNTFYKLYKILIERSGESFPYSPDEFDARCFKYSDGTFGCFVTLPKPESVMLCAYLVYIFKPSCDKLMYFTVETDEFIGKRSFVLCSVTSDGRHIRHGNVNAAPSDIISRISEIIASKS